MQKAIVQEAVSRIGDKNFRSGDRTGGGAKSGPVNGKCMAWVSAVYGKVTGKVYSAANPPALMSQSGFKKDFDGLIPLGSIICFGPSPYYGDHKNGHAGIYVGNNEFVHAFGSRGVVKTTTTEINNLYKSEHGVFTGWLSSDTSSLIADDHSVQYTGGNIQEVAGTNAAGDIKWGINSSSITNSDAIKTFKKNDLELTDDMYVGSDVIRNVKNKVVDMGAGYLIYFDKFLMNKYVTGFSCTCSNDGRINSANIEMVYAPSFWKTEIRDTKTNLYQSFNGIDNGTNVTIFVMNVVTRKFDIVFDGIVKTKTRNKSGSGSSISVSAVNYLDWLNRITVPVSIPLNKSISTGDKIRWLGQGIDVSAIDSIVFARETSFKGKTVVEYVSELIEKTFKNNWLFRDTNTAGNFDDAQNRICIMGDIDEELRKAQCIDFIVSSSTAIVDKMYVMCNEVAQMLLIEFYADRDGTIRLKPPYWNQPVLKDHIIDPSFILSETEYTDYNNFFTRIITEGGQEEYQGNEEDAPDWLTPVGCYVGNMTDPEKAFWADFTGVKSVWTKDGKIINSGSGNSDPFALVGPLTEEQQKQRDTALTFVGPLTKEQQAQQSFNDYLKSNFEKKFGFKVPEQQEQKKFPTFNDYLKSNFEKKFGFKNSER